MVDADNGRVDVGKACVEGRVFPSTRVLDALICRIVPLLLYSHLVRSSLTVDLSPLCSVVPNTFYIQPWFCTPEIDPMS